MLVLGLHRDPYHDTGAAIIHEDGGRLTVVAIAEERLDRVKNSTAYPDKSIDYCLKAVGANSVADCDVVVADYICEPQWSTFRQYQPYQPPRLPQAIAYHLRVALAHRGIKHKVKAGRVKFVNHHLAHAYSAYYGSGFADAAVLIVDGHGSLAPDVELTIPLQLRDGLFETQTLFDASGHGISMVRSSSKTGVGMLYEAFTRFLGFAELQEGKTMGLAPYGAGHQERHIKFSQLSDGIETDYSSLADIWAAPGKWVKQPDLEACTNRSLVTNEYYSRIGWEVQEETERAMIHLADYAKRISGRSKLCLAGGVALNSVANNAIREAGLFQDMWIQPASSDTGIPLGCALYGYYHLGGGKIPWQMNNAYMGRRYSLQEVKKAVSESPGQFDVLGQVDCVAVARILAEGLIVGWFEGASEYGPRALGHRSIVVDPRKAENKDVLNSRVKHRESFRPFAPSVLLERVQEFFEIDVASPFMLLVPKVKPSRIEDIPAVTHIDGTARLQTVTKEDNGAYYELIKAFGELTDVPVVLNTSFNVNGEPIVETPEDAISCFLGTEIDVLVLDGLLLAKKGVDLEALLADAP